MGAVLLLGSREFGLSIPEWSRWRDDDAAYYASVVNVRKNKLAETTFMLLPAIFRGH